jgi:hypothetical protein
MPSTWADNVPVEIAATKPIENIVELSLFIAFVINLSESTKFFLIMQLIIANFTTCYEY